MRAVQIRSSADPRCSQLVDLPIPEPAPDEVLIEVSRAGLNYADTHQRTNHYVAKAELPLVPGAEVAGVRRGHGRARRRAVSATAATPSTRPRRPR